MAQLQNQPDLRETVMTYLLDTRAWYLTYHNHKENCGWVAVAAYTGGALAVCISTIAMQPSMFHRWIVTFAIAVIASIFGTFVEAQLQLRAISVRIVARCNTLWNRWASESDEAIHSDIDAWTTAWNTRPKTEETSKLDSLSLPSWFLVGLEESESTEASQIRARRHRLLEACAYGILLFMTFAMFGRLWWG